jgi:hypothetical protein
MMTSLEDAFKHTPVTSPPPQPSPEAKKKEKPAVAKPATKEKAKAAEPAEAEPAAAKPATKEEAKEPVVQDRIVYLNVGGTKFMTSYSTLCKYPDSKLTSMFGDKSHLMRDNQNHTFVDRDPSTFQLILNFLRTGAVIANLDSYTREALRNEAEFFQLQKLLAQLKPQRIVLGNQDGSDSTPSNTLFKRAPTTPSAPHTPKTPMGRQMHPRSVLAHEPPPNTTEVEKTRTRAGLYKTVPRLRNVQPTPTVMPDGTKRTFGNRSMYDQPCSVTSPISVRPGTTRSTTTVQRTPRAAQCAMPMQRRAKSTTSLYARSTGDVLPLRAYKGRVR